MRKLFSQIAALTLFALLPLSLQAQEGDGKEGSGVWSSGGGLGVATYRAGAPRTPENIIKLVALDLYGIQAEELPRLGPHENLLADVLAEQHLTAAIAKIQAKAPHLAQRILEASERLERWKPYTPLNRTDDTGAIPELATDEALVQIVERRLNTVIYDPDLLAKLDSVNRAALQLHELLYAISNHRNSAAIRRLVAATFTGLIEGMSDESFRTLVSEVLNLKFQALPQSPRLLSWPEGVSPTYNNLETSPGLRCGYITRREAQSVELQSDTVDGVGSKEISHQGHVETTRFVMALLNEPATWSSMTYPLSAADSERFSAALEQAENLLRAKHPTVFYPTAFIDSARACFNSEGRPVVVEVRLFHDSGIDFRETMRAHRIVQIALLERNIQSLEKRLDTLRSIERLAPLVKAAEADIATARKNIRAGRENMAVEPPRSPFGNASLLDAVTLRFD